MRVERSGTLQLDAIARRARLLSLGDKIILTLGVAVSRFEDQVAFVTGAGSGLGRECSLWWAEEGATVVVTDLLGDRAEAVAAQIRDKGGSALGLKVDVTHEAEVEQGVAVAMEAYGRLDIMFANAGKPSSGGGSVPLEEVSEADWDDVNNVVFKGVFFSGKHAALAMKPRRRGNIVVTASAGGINHYPGFGAYCAGKAGAIGLVRAMAFEWGRYGIRVNALAPTHGMSTNFGLPPDADVTGMSYEEAALARSGEAWDPFKAFPGPLKVDRPPLLRDNAAVATFLASDDSFYMSGVTIPACDGGSFARSSIPFPDRWTLDSEV
jgi:NAD(P)-dependent dehydrogenase (short-subunit alcohol dehydrogenase family)